MRARRLRPTLGRVHSKEAPKLKKTLTITVAAVVLIALAASAALFTLSAVAGPHQTCGKVNPAQLRAAADPDYADKLEKLARCGH
jgi:type IV secretory pathway TrbL component